MLRFQRRVAIWSKLCLYLNVQFKPLAFGLLSRNCFYCFIFPATRKKVYTVDA